MTKANNTIFRLYLAMMESFEEFLSGKYPKGTSVEDTKHYQTIIIGKIVRLFHSLELLTRDTLDEVAARCVLRGILDSVTTYTFIYQRSDVNDMLFRHYLYALDGWRVYKKSVITISEDNDYKYKEDYVCDLVINQIEENLRSHTYYNKDIATTESLIQNANWKYESLQNPRSLRYWEMYSIIGFNDNSIEYFQGFLSQFVHGLCLSNRFVNSEQMKRISYESIPIATRFIQAICQTFHNNKEMMKHFLSSDKIQSFLNSKDFNHDDLTEFVQALVRKDNAILI